MRYGGEQPLTKIPTEKNELRYIPLGVGIVIPPWNFPLAILGGMTMGAVAAGNTVVLKPSSDAPGIAKKFMEILEKAKLPPGVVNLVTGPGGDVGEALVQHPQARFISFTGSKEVGLRINEHAARTETDQISIKRVIAEMGGKNAIIVDSEANIDKAVAGVVSSAFGYSGQKCSACSRAIVSADIYDDFNDPGTEPNSSLWYVIKSAGDTVIKDGLSNLIIRKNQYYSSPYAKLGILSKKAIVWQRSIAKKTQTIK